MSGRAQFRCSDGCCICGTKSSSSRFTTSRRFSTDFSGCFGECAVDREGSLCNACVLILKRWLNMTPDKRQIKKFHRVLDSKKGPGPKDLKQITKRQKRKEARIETQMITSPTLPSSSFSTNGLSTPAQSGKLYPSSSSSSSCKFLNSSPLAASTPSCNSSDSASVSMCSVENGSSSGDLFRAPDPWQNVPKRRSYNRRVKQYPVRMPNNTAEVDELMRQIMEQNSEAVNFDCREMHMAVQNQLRLRNRTVALHMDQSSLSSGSFGSSVSNLDNLRNTS